ncbi:IS3 family transposase [Geobacillus zalihae]|nr:IS3 family transposase [Geobacillus zalihae]
MGEPAGIPMEKFFGHLKSEMVDLPTFETEEEMIEAIDQYMYFIIMNGARKTRLPQPSGIPNCPSSLADERLRMSPSSACQR